MEENASIPQRNGFSTVSFEMWWVSCTISFSLEIEVGTRNVSCSSKLLDKSISAIIDSMWVVYFCVTKQPTNLVALNNIYYFRAAVGTALEALGPGVSHGLATKLSAGVQSSQGFTREGSTSKLTHVAAGRIQFLAGWWLVATLGSMWTSPKGSSQHGSLLHQRDQARRARERKCKQGASCRVCFFKYIYFCMCCIIHPSIHTYIPWKQHPIALAHLK